MSFSGLPTRSWAEWRILSVDLADIGPIEVEEFTERFRGEEPTLLVYRLRELPWTGVARLAPVDHALFATRIQGQGQYASERAWVKPLIEDEATYHAFRRELERAGIRQDEVPWELLGPYCQWGAYLDSDASLSFGGVLLGMDRVLGSVVPAEFEEALIDFSSRQLTQFGRYAFWPAGEGEEESEEDEASRDAGGAGYLGARLWRHPLSLLQPSERARLDAVASLTAELGELIPRLEAGEEWDLPLYFGDAVRPGPFFWVEKSLAPPTDDPREAVVAAVLDNLMDTYPRTRADAELYCLRARLVRLLGWPNMYDSLRSIPGFWNGLLRLGQDPHFSDAMPYDIVVELLAFKQEIEERYPVILENPLAGLSHAR